MNIVYVCSPQEADRESVRLRCHNLAGALLASGWHQASVVDLPAFLEMEPGVVTLVHQADVLVIHRYAFGPMLQTVQYWKAHGKRIIVDIDLHERDLLARANLLEARAETLPLARKTGPLPAAHALRSEELRFTLRLANLVTVCSPRLADDWSAYAPTVHLPDYLNLDRYLAVRQQHPGEIWIGLMMAGDGRTELFPGLVDTLLEVARLRPQVRVHIYGSPLPGSGLNGLSADQVVLYNNLSVEEWPRLLGNLNIGLAPLSSEEGMRAGRARVLEYMASKVPWIASNAQPFREFERYGILASNDPDTWMRALLQLVDHNDQYRAEAGGEAFLYALGQDVRENLDRILSIYARSLTDPTYFHQVM